MKESSDVLNIKHQITVDPTPVTTKPPHNERQYIRSRLVQRVDVTIDEFCQMISPPNSFTWLGGRFDGNSSTENWLSQSVFALDFDDGRITVEEVYDRLIEYGITPQLWYETFSSTPLLPKFRVIIFLRTPIKDIKLHQLISKGLLRLFPEADHSCSDVPRYYFGGMKTVVISKDSSETNDLIDMASVVLCASDSMRLRQVPISSINAHNESSAPKGAYLYTNNTKYPFRAIDNTSNSSLPPTSIRGGRLHKINLDISIERIRILREFKNGKWLTHPQLFGLATNLQYVKGGLKFMKMTMNKFDSIGTTNYTQNNYAILTYLKKVNYYPKLIYKFSPYEEDGELHDIISETKNIRGHIKVLEPINKIPLEQSVERFNSEFKKVLDKQETGKVYLFKVPTAIGKTESLTTINGTIASPTNDLKNEISKRMKIEHYKTPDPICFENNSLNNQLKYYYSIGLPRKSMEILHSVINPKNGEDYGKSDVALAIDYLNKMKECYSTSSTLLTTHDRVIHSEFNNDTLIFDEDPLKSIISIKQIKISDLFKINQRVKNNELDKVISKLSSLSPLEVVKTPLFGIDIDEMIKSVSFHDNGEYDSNVFDLFSSNYMIKLPRDENTIHYVVKKDLPIDKKVIILSASAPTEIYKLLYGDRLKVIDISDVEQKGTIVQYTSKSFSRNSLLKNHNEISKEVGDKPVITYKSFSSYFSNPAEMWFGNCSGYDSLKGVDTCVVGTPHLNNIVYLLTACSLGLDIKTSDTSFNNQKVRYNGFEFMFNCYDNEILRKIQFSYIESDLIQAVGRSRTLRTNAKVEVYSNYPLRISNEFRY